MAALAVPALDDNADPSWTDEGEGASESYESDTDEEDVGDEAPVIDNGDSTDEPTATGSGPREFMTVRAHNRTTGEVVLLRAPRGTPMPKILEMYKQKTGLVSSPVAARVPEKARRARRALSPPRATKKRDGSPSATTPPQTPRRTCPRTPVSAQLVTDSGDGGADGEDDFAETEQEGDTTSCHFDWSQLACF